MLYRLSLTGLLFCAHLSLWADSYYFIADPNCTDKLKYTLSSGSNTVDYVHYRYELSGGATLVLELAPGEGELKSNLNGNRVTCGSNVVNKGNYEMVASPGNKNFIALPQSGGSYRLHPIMAIHYMEVNSNSLTYKDWQNAFTIQKSQVQPGMVLNPNDKTGSTIRLERVSSRACLKQYILNQTFSFDPNAAIQITFVPQIGVIQKTGSSSNEVLVSYNDKPLDQAIAEMCQTNPPLTGGPSPTPSPSPSPSPVPAPDQPGQRIHTVSKGETLFSISRQHSASVADIKQWNQLNTNTITPGMKLAVSPPPSSPATSSSSTYSLQAKTPYPSEPDYGKIQQPAPPVTRDVFTQSSPISSPQQPALPAWRTTNGTHLVLPGETVASIAKKYGYTEERFRDMNDLKPYENVRVNQVLKTTDRLTSPASGSPAASQTSRTSFSSSTVTVPFEPYGDPGYFQDPASISTPRSAVPSTGQPSNMSPKGLKTYQPEAGPTPSTSPTLNFYNPSAGSQPAQPQEPSSFYQPNPVNPSPPSSSLNYSPTGTRSNSQAGPNYYSSAPAGQTPSYDPGMTSNGVQFSAKGMASDQPTKPMGNGATPSNTASQPNDGTHLVQPGESLASIAQRYGITVAELRQINNLEPGEIFIPGERIYVSR